MKIISWNVNGIRACYKKNLAYFLRDQDPHIFCVQETKAHPDQVDPVLLTLNQTKSYWSSAKKKGYSGVATFVKEEPRSILYGIKNTDYDSEGRFVVTDHGDFLLYNVYFPNGGSGEVRHLFKQNFLKDFLKHLEDKIRQGREVIVLGDYNVAHTELDIYDPVRLSKESGFLPEERTWFDEFFKAGFVDVWREKNPGVSDRYTWWSYREMARLANRGWRIDYICVTKKLAAKVTNAFILDHVEGSDHCPVGVELKI